MTKWIKVDTGRRIVRLNASNIRRIANEEGYVTIDKLFVKEFVNAKEAEKFIENFIAEHYVKTEKVE